MKTATEMREAFIETRRSQSVKDYLTDVNERQAENGNFQDKTEHDGLKIGDKISYTDSRYCQGSYSISKKQGWLFAVGDNALLIWDGKKLVKVGV